MCSVQIRIPWFFNRLPVFLSRGKKNATFIFVDFTSYEAFTGSDILTRFLVQEKTAWFLCECVGTKTSDDYFRIIIL